MKKQSKCSTYPSRSLAMSGLPTGKAIHVCRSFLPRSSCLYCLVVSSLFAATCYSRHRHTSLEVMSSCIYRAIFIQLGGGTPRAALLGLRGLMRQRGMGRPAFKLPNAPGLSNWPSESAANDAKKAGQRKHEGTRSHVISEQIQRPRNQAGTSQRVVL